MIDTLIRNIWFRLSVIGIVLLCVLIGVISASKKLIIQPLETQLNELVNGKQRMQEEIINLEKTIKKINNTFESRTDEKKNMYAYHYQFYKNPVGFINRYVLTEAKPTNIVIVDSSINPSKKYRIKDKSDRHHFMRITGQSKDALEGLFEIVDISISAMGDFNDISQYIHNISSIPINFELKSFEIRERNSAIELKVTLCYIAYKFND